MLIYRPRNALHDDVIIAIVESEENDLLYGRASNSCCEWDRWLKPSKKRNRRLFLHEENRRKKKRNIQIDSNVQ